MTERLKTFERERRHLLSVAFRILGSQADAEDVVQETWIRYDAADTNNVENLPAWLTTVASRLCIDQLRRRRDIPQEDVEAMEPRDAGRDPEQTALLASELTTAFTVVLQELTPPQRVALVLHDAFGVPFEDVAHILNTTLLSAKKLASRARGRVRRRTATIPEDRTSARRIAAAFLKAAQDGNTAELSALLDPDIIRIADPQVLPSGGAQRIEGVETVVADTVRFREIALRARLAEIDGNSGIVLVSGQSVALAIVLRIERQRIVQFDVIADPQRLERLNVRIDGVT